MLGDMTGRLMAALLTGLLLASCGEEGGATPTDSASSTITKSPKTAPPSEPMMHSTEIVAAESEFGRMLFDSHHQAIYLFDIETTGEPKCFDDCAEAWPPVLTDGDPVAGPGVKASLLGTTERSDGTTQVTYGGHPLYFYAHEEPGEVKCHDVFLNGGNWYVVQPDGDAA